MRPGPILAFALLAAVGAVGWYWLNDPASPQAPPNRQQGRRAAHREGPVPVTVEPVRTDTVPVFREGIGNVQALYSVTVHSQIDGRLMSVDFTEGEIVRKGAVLARIDPVVYQAQYDQAAVSYTHLTLPTILLV